MRKVVSKGITHSNYEVDPDTQEIWSITKSGIRRRVQTPCSSVGYPRWSMWDKQKGRPVVQLVHRVMWETFVGPIPEGMQIDHINGDKTDNRLENLELVTCKENVRRAFDSGLMATGEKHGSNKVKVDDLKEIFKMRMEHIGDDVPREESTRIICQQFGISKSTLMDHLRGRGFRRLDYNSIPAYRFYRLLENATTKGELK